MGQTVVEPARTLPVRADVDVLVCGGGPAGALAALAAARNGARTMLVEQYGFAGGTVTAAMINGIGGWQHDLDGRPLIAGLPAELMHAVAHAGGANADWVAQVLGPVAARPSYREGGLGCYWIDLLPEVMKTVLDDLLLDAGVTLLYHAVATAPIMDGQRVVGAFVESKSGREAVLARAVVDATGDGDIAARAGAEFQYGRASDGACQPMSLIFVLDSTGEGLATLWAPDATHSDLARGRYRGAMALARARGEIALNPNDIICAATPVGADTTRAVNATRVQHHSAIDATQLTAAEVLGRRQVREIQRFIRTYVVGCQAVNLVVTGPHIGTRESRRIIGDYVLTGEDVRNGIRVEDAIARGIYLLDIHNPTGIGEPSQLVLLDQPYDIPYRCLLPRGIEGLLVAGRCISGDATALASYRIVSHCMAMGEAAGTAAALAARHGTTPRAIGADAVRAQLRRQGANVGPGTREE